ncbi:MAG: hypothetical protein ACI9W6_003224 [Motiliproteus sp.]|jgi:hypothetical protein
MQEQFQIYCMDAGTEQHRNRCRADSVKSDKLLEVLELRGRLNSAVADYPHLLGLIRLIPFVPLPVRRNGRSRCP